LDNQIVSRRCVDGRKMSFLFHAENFSISTSMGSVLRKKVQPAQVDPIVGFLFKRERQRPRTNPTVWTDLGKIRVFRMLRPATRMTSISIIRA